MRGVDHRGIIGDGSGNVDEPRLIGSIQDDALQDHQHALKDWGFDKPAANINIHGGGTQKYLSFEREGKYETEPASKPLENAATGDAGNPPRTATETRPRNITVFFYIRID